MFSLRKRKTKITQEIQRIIIHFCELYALAYEGISSYVKVLQTEYLMAICALF